MVHESHRPEFHYWIVLKMKKKTGKHEAIFFSTILRTTILLIVITFFVLGIQFVSAEVTPLTMFSDKNETGVHEWQQNYYTSPQYYYEKNILSPINTTITATASVDYPFQVIKNYWSFTGKNNGTFYLKKKNQEIQGKLIGIGFYNISTGEAIQELTPNLVTGLTNGGNSLFWNIPFYDANYFLEVNNGAFRDVFTFSQELKNYFKLHQPLWISKNTYFGLFYDLNFLDSNKAMDLINFSSEGSTTFSTTDSIYFFDENEMNFILVNKFVESADYNQFSLNNVNNKWKKLKVYKKGKYFELIPVQALDSIGDITFNSSVTIPVSVGSDDADESNAGTVNLTRATLDINSSQFGAGMMFRKVSLPLNSTISSANLTFKFAYACDPICEIDVFGVDSNTAKTWATTNKPSTQTLTTASVNFDVEGTMEIDGSFGAGNLNVKTIIQELYDSQFLNQDNNVGFIFDRVTVSGSNYIQIVSYESPSIEGRLTINFSAPCYYQKDENFIITTECFFADKLIDLNKGYVFIDWTGALGLTRSFLRAKGINLMAVPITFQVVTQDGNMTADSNFSSVTYKDRASHQLGNDQHNLSYWGSVRDTSPHWIQVDLNHNDLNIQSVSFPLNYWFNWFTDVNITYWDGSWHTLFLDKNFQTDDCTTLSGAGLYSYCDMNFTLNVPAQKFRFDVNGLSKTAGVGGDYGGQFTVNDIILYYYPKQQKDYLILTKDSNINLHRN
jgi:hypothetical protein